MPTGIAADDGGREGVGACDVHEALRAFVVHGVCTDIIEAGGLRATGLWDGLAGGGPLVCEYDHADLVGAALTAVIHATGRSIVFGGVPAAGSNQHEKNGCFAHG